MIPFLIGVFVGGILGALVMALCVARVADVPNIIRGHKSHWQETFDRVQRDQLLDDVAAHVEAWLKEG